MFTFETLDSPSVGRDIVRYSTSFLLTHSTPASPILFIISYTLINHSINTIFLLIIRLIVKF